MVFSSQLPLYLDPPNWQQHQQLAQGFRNHENHEHHQHQPPHPPPPRPPPQQQPPELGGGGGRANSTAERARLAKIVPQPETPLKCPRCESTNTKFCYFNNYSLSQPRHFCKTCRRYWTRGGALRNVPVGGGCRRNNNNNGKRSKSSNHRPKSPAASSNTASIATSTTTTTTTNLVSNINHQAAGRVGVSECPSFGAHLFLQPSYLATLQNLNRLGMGNLGLNLEPQMQDIGVHHFQAGGSYDNGSAQEMPFLGGGGGGGGFDVMSVASATPMIPYHNFHNGGSALAPSYDNNNMMMMRSATRGNDNGDDDHDQIVLAQMNGVKMEDNQVGGVISKQLIGMPLPGHNHEQIWGDSSADDQRASGGNVWTDLSGITSTASAAHMI